MMFVRKCCQNPSSVYPDKLFSIFWISIPINVLTDSQHCAYWPNTTNNSRGFQTSLTSVHPTHSYHLTVCTVTSLNSAHIFHMVKYTITCKMVKLTQGCNWSWLIHLSFNIKWITNSFDNRISFLYFCLKVKYVLVPASPTWRFDSFLCLIWK